MAKEGSSVDVLAVCAAGDEAKMQEAMSSMGHGSFARWCHPETQWTGLHAATKAGHARIAETLLRFGADPSATTHHQSTPLRIAVSNKHATALGLLAPVLCSLSSLNPICTGLPGAQAPCGNIGAASALA